MKKKILSIILVLALPVLAMFFPLLLSNQTTSAIIQNSSGNNFVLTGPLSSSARHYFGDANNNSTLVNVELESDTSVDENYYVLSAKAYQTNLLIGQKSSGWAEIKPTADMQALIDEGVVYGQVEFGFTQKSNNNQSRIKATLSYGDLSSTIETDANVVGQTITYSTEKILLSGEYNLRFSFETVEANRAASGSNFVLSRPTIKFYTELEDFTFENTDATVMPGQVITLRAYNDITSYNGNINGDFSNYSKIEHAIEYEITSGGEYASITGTSLSISQDTPNGTEIKVRARCKKNSLTDEYFDWKEVVYIVDSQKVDVKITSDFANPARFDGEGEYYSGEGITLSVVSENNGYTFTGWQVYDINGNVISSSTRRTLLYRVAHGQIVKANFVKDISLSGIQIASKQYDGKTAVDEDLITYIFSGQEDGHEIYIDNIEEISLTYSSSQVGTSAVTYQDENLTSLVLGGKDAGIYKLSKTFSGFTVGASPIVKRQISVSVNSSEKVYGDQDPAYQGVLSDGTTLAEGDQLSEVLALSFTREEGEDVGKYAINPVYQDEEEKILVSDTNYEVLYKQSGTISYLTINEREVSISQIVVESKTYDGKADATVSGYRIDNVVEGDDLTAVFEASFTSVDAGTEKEVAIEDVTLQGEDAGNYVLKESDYSGITGRISQREITVTAEDITATYGSEPVFKFDVENLVEGEELKGSLSVDGNDVGTHSISRGTLDILNPNYQITFVSANCQITPKPIDVYAQSGQQKEYGDSDSMFEFYADGLVGDDVLSGQLSRVEGDEVGDYDILQGTLTNENNPNYDITFHPSIFKIVKREITINVQFLDKVYDGGTEVIYNENFRVQNALPDQTINLLINANLLSANAGSAKIDTDNIFIEVVNKDESHFIYTITYNEEILISKRPVTITVQDNSKVYGEEDPEIKYEIDNVVDGESLTVEILRNVGESGNGENVGRYSYYLGSKNYEENPNYDISMQGQSFLTITAREIVVESENAEKVFGDEDPAFKVFLKEGTLAFDDELEQILTGTLSREEGESVGSYKIEIGTLSAQNYRIVYAGDAVLVIGKRDVYVTFDNVEKTYGDEDPTFTYSAQNAVAGQEVVLDIVRARGEDVGSYKISLGNDQDARYNIFFEEGAVLTINPSPITLQAENKFKHYGDSDPVLSVIITNGILKNNDTLSAIMQGALVREEGENIGSYKINLGDLSLGKNYDVTFTSGSLTIYPLPIEITADNIEKTYGDSDPHFTFAVTDGHLVEGDLFTGELSREEGEGVGSYQINIGTLALNDNYEISFVAGQLDIVKRRITIVPTTTSKIYGEEEGEIEYSTIGSLVGDDVLEGHLEREKPTSSSNPKLYENVGRYKIISTLSSDNYEIVFGDYYFEILAREIKIKADDKTIVYGEENVPLTYQIESGEILEGDTLSGGLYRATGDNVGKYDIQSSLTLGSNYHIIYTKGTYEILPIKITVKSSNYSKVYGQFDPEFAYEIAEGELLEGDIIYGSLSRESGEDVGTYALVNNLTNPNYEITLIPSYLSITPKDVYLVAGVQDKPYDGTAKATIKTPVVSGLIDRDVYLVYDSENCAYFATAEAGDNIPVSFYDITLAGDKAGNYHLIYPTDVTGSITYDVIEKDDIAITSPDNANLYFGTSLNYEMFDIDRTDMGLNIRQVVQGYNIWLEKDSSIFDVTTSVTLIIDIPSAFADRNNLYVYHKGEDGQYTLVSSRKNEAGQLVITTDELGEFVIMTDNDSWIDLSATICIVLLFILLMIALIAYIRKRALRR